jgi:PKD repeat protein
MSLNKPGLVAALIEVFTNEQSEETNANASVTRLANGIANAIETFVKSGRVNVNVTTTGSVSAQTGTGTGNIT